MIVVVLVHVLSHFDSLKGCANSIKGKKKKKKKVYISQLLFFYVKLFLKGKLMRKELISR